MNGIPITYYLDGIHDNGMCFYTKKIDDGIFTHSLSLVKQIY